MAGKMMDDIVRCSFCNKTQAQVRKLIAGPNGTYICDECIGICSEIIEEELDYSEGGTFDDINLLTPEEMKEAVALINGRAKTECSGNVTKENISRLKQIGVDYISSGALTHSAPILDISLKNLHVV